MLEKKIGQFISLIGVECNVYDVKLKTFENPHAVFCSKCPNPCDYKNTHLYGCYESVRWDNKYIYYCPMEFIFVAVPVTDEDNILTSGVIIGPILMGATDDNPQTIGNAALGGAVRLLLNTQEWASCARYVSAATVVTLSGNPIFTEEYMERTLFDECI